MNERRPQTISCAALARDFVAIGEQGIAGVQCKFFLEHKTGRGVSVTGSDDSERVEITSEIIFSRRKREFSVRIFNEDLELACSSLWLTMGEWVDSISIEGFSQSFDEQLPKKFSPLVSAEELKIFLFKREFSQLTEKLVKRFSVDDDTTNYLAVSSCEELDMFSMAA